MENELCLEWTDHLRHCQAPPKVAVLPLGLRQPLEIHNLIWPSQNDRLALLGDAHPMRVKIKICPSSVSRPLASLFCHKVLNIALKLVINAWKASFSFLLYVRLNILRSMQTHFWSSLSCQTECWLAVRWELITPICTHHGIKMVHHGFYRIAFLQNGQLNYVSLDNR